MFSISTGSASGTCKETSYSYWWDHGDTNISYSLSGKTGKEGGRGGGGKEGGRGGGGRVISTVQPDLDVFLCLWSGTDRNALHR